MSALSDALAALKNVVLMQERLDSMRTEQTRINGDLRDLNTYAQSIDKRLIRIETMIEMNMGRGATPRLEGN